MTVFCNATGNPQPQVKWIRGGSFAIDPSMVRTDETAAKWSLIVANVTEDTTFYCVAQNPLGVANWTIKVNMAPGSRTGSMKVIANVVQG